MKPILVHRRRPVNCGARPVDGGSPATAMLSRAVALLLLLSLVGACSAPPVRSPLTDATLITGDCLTLYRELDAAALEAGVIDPAYHRRPGLPYLRGNRFLASFDPAELDEPGYQSWLAHQNRLANEGLYKEWLRLTPAQRPDAFAESSSHKELSEALAACGEQLLPVLSREPRLPPLTVPDDYHLWLRVVGLYPLTGLPFRWGVVREHEDIRHTQARQRARLAQGEGLADWTLFRVTEMALEPPQQLSLEPQHQPSSEPQQALRELAALPRDALGVPVLSETEQRQLLAAFMPAFALQHSDGELADNDWPGRVQVDGADFMVDANQPSLYTHISHGHYRGSVALQLNYSVWFSERRPESRLDLLAGRFNGVTWRVHLLPEGAVLGYDKVHQCGCWYQFYPAMGFRARPELPFAQEPVYIGPALDPRVRHTLWLEANTHMLLAVTGSSPAPTGERVEMQVLANRELRALPGEGEEDFVGLFDERGLLPQSRRPERYLFWPMGIASAGALRAHGRHAIAFIGRRHFDDPFLLEELELR